MKRIQEYQMLLNASKIPYLEKKKSYLCESNCNSPENVAEIMEKCFQMSNLPEEHVYAIALNSKIIITCCYSNSFKILNSKVSFSKKKTKYECIYYRGSGVEWLVR